MMSDKFVHPINNEANCNQLASLLCTRQTWASDDVLHFIILFPSFTWRWPNQQFVCTLAAGDDFFASVEYNFFTLSLIHI